MAKTHGIKGYFILYAVLHLTQCSIHHDYHDVEKILNQQNFKPESNSIDDVLNKSPKKLLILDDLVNNVQKIDEEMDNLYQDLILKREKRFKREANNDTVTPSIDTDIKSNVTTPEDIDKVTESSVTVGTATKPCICNNTNISMNKSETEQQSGRRAVVGLNFPMDSSAPDMKSKLVNYLEDTFAELQNKIRLVDVIKQNIHMENGYKIGYITANIDILGVYLKNLKMDLDENKDVWDGPRILDLFEKLRNSNKILTKLLRTIKMLLK